MKAWLLLYGLVLMHGAAMAGEVHVAVASNFAEPAREIAMAFTAKTGDDVLLSTGSTGQLYAQIAQGAPYDVFLAADQARAAKAVEDGFALPESRFTYASGTIVLFSAEPDQVNGEATLRRGDFTRLAIANPMTAPYGAAAVEAMQAFGVYDQLEDRIVQGNNIAQAYQFVATGNAELGFVALAQVIGHDEGSRWIVPETLYAPIAQDAVRLEQGAKNDAARGFLEFLKRPEARALIEAYGYATGD